MDTVDNNMVNPHPHPHHKVVILSSILVVKIRTSSMLLYNNQLSSVHHTQKVKLVVLLLQWLTLIITEQSLLCQQMKGWILQHLLLGDVVVATRAFRLI